MGGGGQSASSNVFVGASAGTLNLSGSQNTLIGAGAGNSGQTSSRNTLIGYQSGSELTSSDQVFVGYQAGNSNTNGINNTFVGFRSGSTNINGGRNTFLGYFAGYSNNTGSSNSFSGAGAGYYNTTGVANTLMGAEVGFFNSTGNQNTFIGYRAGYYSVAGANTFIGYQAVFNTTTGQFNTFMGVNAGASNTTGNSNFMLGTNAGANSTSGTANFFVGDNAGATNTTGGFNVFLGTNAGASNTVGANNTAIGFEANVGSGGLVNATAIGFRAVAATNNSLVLGNGANVGIGTTAPTNKLHLVSGTSGLSGLRLENLTSGNPASVTNQNKFLTVDGAGNVILGSTNSSAREAAASESLWQRKGAFLASTQGEAVIIGQGVDKTPADYNLFVSKGILTEKVKVAVKNTADWSDKVFEKGYPLKSLGEVEQHIKLTGHLPGLASAAEVVKQGIDVAKMDAKLLEKIEELTLYSIQLEKASQEQKVINQQLKGQVDELTQLVKQLLNKK